MNAQGSVAALPSAAANIGDRVPFIRLDETDELLFAALMAEVERVARQGAFTLGEEVESFEREFADYCETADAVGVSSGTAALELALRALGIGPGDEVVVPTYTFIATAEAVTSTGATPILVDVDPESAVVTAEIVERALSAATRCVIPVHLFGRTVEMEPLLDLCRPRGIRVIEDACQAHGARYHGRRVGSIGDAGCFSFYPTKNLGGWGDGGALVTDDAELSARVRLLRSHGEAVRHDHEVPAGTDRLHGLQAAVLRVKLGRLDQWNQSRREAARTLASELSQTGLRLPPPASAEGDHVYHLFVVGTPARDALRVHLQERGIASAIHYPTPIHLQPAYEDAGLPRGSLPNSEALAAECCSLPLFPAIEDWQIAEIAESVESFGAGRDA